MVEDLLSFRSQISSVPVKIDSLSLHALELSNIWSILTCHLAVISFGRALHLPFKDLYVSWLPPQLPDSQFLVCFKGLKFEGDSSFTPLAPLLVCLRFLPLFIFLTKQFKVGFRTKFRCMLASPAHWTFILLPATQR